MRNDEIFSEQTSLALIESMINKARDHFSENGFLYLLWGWVVFICSVMHFILLKIVHFDRPYIVWFLVWLVFFYQFIYIARRKKRLPVKTYTHHIVRYVWVTFMVSLFIIMFIVIKGQGSSSYLIMNPLFLALYGIPTFLSGVIMKFKSLLIGGLGCWGLALVACFIPYEYQLLLISAAMLIAWIIPGYIMKARFKNINK